MRVPLSWLRDYADLPADTSAREVADRLVDAGLEVEGVLSLGRDVTGPVVVGRVLEFRDETHSNGKTVRWCTVDVGAAEPRGIVCGALNFAVGDHVVVALPGAVLPGGFAISARRTYGHVSDGMVCSARELGLGEDAEGILVLPESPPVGADAPELLGLRDDVLDIAVTPDRGYCMSVRGIAREAATAFGVAFADPVSSVMTADLPPLAWPVELADEEGCDSFVALRITGVEPTAASPLWLQRRLRLAGMRSISLAVDVTNHVMLDVGQPLHAYDAGKLKGAIVVRRARAGERLRTLDGVDRELHPDDLLITDDSGPIGIAGVMGGESTEISAGTIDIVLESAHFDPATVSRSSRRHRLPSEASRRFERGVDPFLGYPAAQRAAHLLAELGGGRVEHARTLAGSPAAPAPVTIDADLPARVVGVPYDAAEVHRQLTAVGCRVEAVDGGGRLRVSPPSWRPDLRDPYDLVEEVARLHGYAAIPARLPVAPAGRGLTETQRARRRVGRALAAAGYVEAPSYPFVGPAVLDGLGLPARDPRRRALRLANPLSEEEPLLRTTLLPGLLGALRRNVGRGTVHVGLYEMGLVFRPRPGHEAAAPVALPVDRRPTADQLAALDAALPEQPWRVGVVLSGERERAGWWGEGRAGCWADAIEAARAVARAAGVQLSVRADEHAPWHPGRCAALHADGTLVGHAGELHPRVVAALGLPPRTSAAELDLDRLLPAAGGVVEAPIVSTYPVATLDVALVVDAAVPAARVEQALRDGAGALLESVRLFDVYTGEQVGAGRRSLAYALRLRASDRTLTVEEATTVRNAAVAEANRRTGAALRG